MFLLFVGLSSFGGLANKMYKSHFPKIVVLNSMLWSLQDMDFANKPSNIDQDDDHGYQFFFINQTNFVPFAESYVRNITILVSQRNYILEQNFSATHDTSRKSEWTPHWIEYSKNNE